MSVSLLLLLVVGVVVIFVGTVIVVVVLVVVCTLFCSKLCFESILLHSCQKRLHHNPEIMDLSSKLRKLMAKQGGGGDSF